MITKSKNVAQSFEKLKILLDLENKLRKDQGMMSRAYLKAIEDKRDPLMIIDNLQGDIRHNAEMMKRVLGEDLFKRISEFKP